MSDYRVEVTREDGKAIHPAVVEVDGQGFFVANGVKVQAIGLMPSEGGAMVPVITAEYVVEIEDGEHMPLGVVVSVEGARHIISALTEALQMVGPRPVEDSVEVAAEEPG